MTRISIDRRAALRLGAALVLTASGGTAAFAAATGQKKLVFVILRGAMDGLAACAPYGDANYRAVRGQLALGAPGVQDGVLPLGDGFGLHPSLAFLHEAYGAKELAILHAAASPYRERSHFDGQDVLESGGDKVFGAADGWLNRALQQLPGDRRGEALAVGATVPLVLRGQAAVTSWSPSFAPAASDDTVSRLMDLYAGDPLLGPALARSLETQAMVNEAGVGDQGAGGRNGPGAYRPLAQAAAKLIAAPEGPAVAVLSFDGWDTHANQGAAQGQLALRFAGLDAALKALKEGLGAQWKDTVVIVATEFGRTVAVNGTGGTDHGTGQCAFALGGAVKGGRMLGDWPTLAPTSLRDNRDLAPANDLRALFMAPLRDHLGIDRAALQSLVFPNAAGVAPLDGLIAA